MKKTRRMLLNVKKLDYIFEITKKKNTTYIFGTKGVLQFILCFLSLDIISILLVLYKKIFMCHILTKIMLKYRNSQSANNACSLAWFQNLQYPIWLYLKIFIFLKLLLYHI